MSLPGGSWLNSLSERLHRGSPVIVGGHLHSFSWRDIDDTPHSLLEIQAHSLQVLEKTSSSPEVEETMDRTVG